MAKSSFSFPGIHQQADIEFNEMFSPVVKPGTGTIVVYLMMFPPIGQFD